VLESIAYLDLHYKVTASRFCLEHQTKFQEREAEKAKRKKVPWMPPQFDSLTIISEFM
jgi:hypothetical protein